MNDANFDRDPGLTVRVLVVDAEPIDGGDTTVGTAVRVTRGIFAGLVGHVHEMDDLANVVVREGSPEEWIGR